MFDLSFLTSYLIPSTHISSRCLKPNFYRGRLLLLNQSILEPAEPFSPRKPRRCLVHNKRDLLTQQSFLKLSAMVGIALLSSSNTGPKMRVLYNTGISLKAIICTSGFRGCGQARNSCHQWKDSNAYPIKFSSLRCSAIASHRRRNACGHDDISSCGERLKRWKPKWSTFSFCLVT